ncbi:exodeoxyribonuclease VII large subunit [bacterium]|nr:exodeoxyribonuclease VII large subunit [bacterium]
MSSLFDAADFSDKPSERRVYSVSELTREIRLTLENHFPPLWIEGEISNFKPHSSGHYYFSLKDAEAQLNCVMWRGANRKLVFRPEDGMKVEAMGHITVYERQGRVQLDVQIMQPVGVGDLQHAFEMLKQKLYAEGLFDAIHKKPLPEFPRTIGVVTSETGAAIQDIISVIRRRFPGLRILLRPARVQGEGAAEDIARGIEDLNAHGEADVIIVGRGGGSLEDLWAFNEERVAKAIFNSVIPVVSAVGHEIDFSISDFVADMRAPTPSAAAELIVRDREELRQSVLVLAGRFGKAIGNQTEMRRERLNALTRRYAFRQPSVLVREYRQRLDDLRRIIEEQQKTRIREMKLITSKQSGRLAALNPESVLKRGYSITTRTGDKTVVTRAADVELEENLTVRLAEGALQATVKYREVT